MIEQTQYYNGLIPPSNPDYPWKGEVWQVLCYYCNQPISLTVPWAGNRQRAVYHWVHPGGGYNCLPENVRPTEEIDDPRCHCGTQEADKHAFHCSAAGKPTFHAMPMNAKEDELIKYFGWAQKELAES